MKACAYVAVILALGACTAAPPAAAAKTSLGYVLPKTIVNVQVLQTLTGCPEKPGDPLEIETSWAIVPVAVADPDMRFEIDTSAGFLAKRSTALVLRPDGTPESFNVSASGQGAAVVASLAELAKTLVLSTPPAPSPAPAGVPAPSAQLACKPEILKTLAVSGKLGEDIGAIEDRVLLGTATAAERQLLERKRKKRAALREALTLASGGAIEPPEWDGVNESALKLRRYIKPLGYGAWFSNLDTAVLADGAIPGLSGFRVAIDPSDGAASLRSGAAATPKEERTPVRAIYYRQPLRGTIVGAPCVGTPPGDGSCEVAERGAAVSEPVVAGFGQWAGVRSLPVGTGGLFGSREAKAKFDPFGTPIEISYGSDSGAAGVATSLDAARGAVTDVRDAKLAELERAIKLEEARQKLAELRATADE
ncbi:MAG: hypothetical protein ACT6Q5_14265 [Sphingopyxis solisilvae]|uniref:hypothetical protein n=1 Tax=Sphingopyxis solisilvae TaxID=1886788 RepID=UPI004035EFE3